jgi:AraC-like DNA-binding protein
MVNQTNTREQYIEQLNERDMRRGNVTFKQLLENPSEFVRFTEAWIVSSMPRGGLQLLQPANVDDAWLRPYTREFHTEDAASWRAITEKRPLRGDDCFPGGFEQSRYYRAFLKPAGVRYMAVAPLASPVLEGYPGALHVYRSAEMGEFSDQDLRRLKEVAAELDRKEAESRSARTTGPCAVERPWIHRPKTRQLILDARLHSLLGDKHDLDDRVASQLLADAKHRFENIESDLQGQRLSVADSTGDLWNFHVMPFESYPALSRGAVIFYCLEPRFCDWKTIRAADVAADSLMARLVPAMHYMQEEFQRGPTLNPIAKTVHLSPFHFHRRFADLMGITPKHFLLECQIFLAKQLLVDGKKDLVDIAKLCGFAHQSHFTSRFKQAAGLTPTRWRKMARRLEQPARG